MGPARILANALAGPVGGRARARYASAMNRRDLFAYALIGLGALALLARLTDGAGWLWIALVAAAMLGAYVSQRTYGFLVVGGLLAGTAVGLLLQQAFPRCDGVFLISLGIGLVAIDAVERRESRWPRSVGIGLAGLGLVLALATSGVFGTAWFALLLIAVGGLLLWRRHEATAFPPPLVPRPSASAPPTAIAPPSAHDDSDGDEATEPPPAKG